MRVLSVILTKGGVGKTTVTANLHGLLADAGLRALLDLDSQPTLSSYYPLNQTASAVYELIALNLIDQPQLIFRTKLNNLDLILFNDHQGPLNTLLLHPLDGRLCLHHLLDGLRNHYNLLQIDTQSARSVLLEMAVLASDLALSPINPKMLAARELSRCALKLLDDLTPFCHLGITMPPLRLLLNQVDAVRLDARMIMRGLRNSFPAITATAVLNTAITNREAYVNAASLGLSAHRVDTHRASGRRSPSALEILQAIVIELFPEWQVVSSTVGLSMEKP